MNLLRRLRYLLHHRRLAVELSEEMELHRQMIEDELRTAGLEPGEARDVARRQLGNAARANEQARGVWIPLWLESVGQDVRYALRGFRRNPGFAVAAVLALALGIGANTAIFSLINAVALRPLPVSEPARLVQIARVQPDGRAGGVSYPLFEHLRDHLRTAPDVFAHATSSESIVIDGEEDFVTADLVTGAYYRVLALDPAAGRLLGPADDALSPPTLAAVISSRYWERRFGRSPSAIGKPVTIGDRVFTIVGVTPSSFQSAVTGHAPDLTLPLLPVMSEEQRGEATNNSLNVLARLKPGVSVEQAAAEVEVLHAAFVRAQAARAPESDRADILRQRATALSAPGGFNPLSDFVDPLLVLMGIVGLMLLLVCVNLSGLLLARAAARQREISIRLAIGASRGRLVRQLVTESLALASIGGAIGVVLAGWFSALLVSLFADGREVVLSVPPDRRVLAFACAVSLLACLVAGPGPALRAVGRDVHPALKGVRGERQRRFGKGVVVVQLAISMVLMVGATWLVGTLVELYSVDPGFRADGVLVVNVRSTRPLPPERGMAVQRALLDRMGSLPGVTSVSAVHTLPIGGNLWTRTVEAGGLAGRGAESADVGFNVIAPSYFATVGTPLLLGREFTDLDRADAPKVAIVNESLARHLFPEGSVLGSTVTSVGVPYEIVGVVRDAKYQGLRDQALGTMYIPWMQREGEKPSAYSYLLRVAGDDPLRLQSALEGLVQDVDADLRLRSATTYATVIGRSITAERIMGSLGGLFGLFALVVAGLGVFGMLAFHVTRRARELGVRIAVGATRWSIIRLVLKDVVQMLVPGLLIGVVASLLLAGLARKIVFGFAPDELGVFVVAASVLAFAAVLAGWIPARRASRLDPVIALRQD
jgi:predicted permease